MSMGIVNDEDFDREVNSLNPLDKVKLTNQNKAVIIENKGPGRGKGDIEVPNGLRKIIGEESVINGKSSALELASSFGISKSSVSAYANGSTSTRTYNETEKNNLNGISDHINKSKERVMRRAQNKLMSALSYITEEKLADTKARELAGIAKDMSAVIKNFEPEVQQNNNQNGPTFVFYAPSFRKEEAYETIYVTE